jgi:O-antigen ligase
MAVKAPPPRSVGRTRTIDVEVQIAHDKARARVVYGAIIVLTLFIAAVAYTRAPEPFPIALLVLMLACVCAFLRPAAGIYVLVFLTMVGDVVTMPWWPFTKNMSSRESILYVNDNLFLNPLEVLAAITMIAWLLRSVADPTWRFVRGRMFWPILIFTGFVVFGYARGISSGGDRRVAIFEGRALFYVFVVYVLVTNLLSTRRQYVRLFMTAMVGLAIQSIFSLLYYRGLSGEVRSELESLGEHSATIPMDALLVLLIGALVFKGSRWLRWSTFLLAIPVTYAYILSNRRAAMVALFAGVLIVIVVLYQRRRRAFWFLAPATLLVGLGFVLATWNAEGAISLPAKAVKTVLFPNQLSARDSSSDLYRQIEASNIYYTIQSSRLFGYGFGRPFLQVIPMPNISFFEFWQYIPHNNVLWIWIKLGFFGFVAMLFMFGRCVQLGARSVTQIRSADHVAFATAGLAYVVMFLVFAYVDIAWDPRSTVLLGVSMALSADFVNAYDIDAERHRVPAFQLVPQ